MPAFSPEQRVILVVDDCESDVVLLKRAFQKSGLNFPVQSVPGGLEALAYLNGDPPFNDRKRYPMPALILLDMRMPQVDGLEVLRWIRHCPQFAEVPVVMLTGTNEIEHSNRAHELGANSVQVKSLDFGSSSALFGAVQQLIKGYSPKG